MLRYSRGVHAHSCIMGNQGKMAEIQRLVLEFKANLILLNSYIRRFLFENSNLRVQRNNTLNLECKCLVIKCLDQFLENLDFSIHFL